ncbi:MAG: hypothetical protein IIV41_07080 [Akkermansia sp.]|nr:hypothetical protein [Akkermansia sp.]
MGNDIRLRRTKSTLCVDDIYTCGVDDIRASRRGREMVQSERSEDIVLRGAQDIVCRRQISSRPASQGRDIVFLWGEE